jgi:hypothetical protein
VYLPNLDPQTPTFPPYLDHPMEFVVLPPAMFLTTDDERQQQRVGTSSSMIVVQL